MLLGEFSQTNLLYISKSGFQICLGGILMSSILAQSSFSHLRLTSFHSCNQYNDVNFTSLNILVSLSAIEKYTSCCRMDLKFYSMTCLQNKSRHAYKRWNFVSKKQTYKALMYSRLLGKHKLTKFNQIFVVRSWFFSSYQIRG